MFMSQEEFEKLPKEQQDTLMKKITEIQNGVPPVPKGLSQLSMDEFKAIVNETAKEYIKGMTSVDKKFYAFPGIGTDGLSDVSPEGKFSKTIRFLKAISTGNTQVCRDMSNEVRTKANLSEGTATSGGFLVPEEFAAEILRLAPTYGIVRQNCRIIPMRYDTISIPAAGGTDLTAQWVSEAGTLKSTDPNYRQVQLVINKLASIPKVTTELLADANVDVVSYLSMLIAEAFAKEEDTQGFIGSGAPFVGIMNGTGMPTYPHIGGTGFITLSYPDLVQMSSHLYSGATANAKFYFHRTIIGHIRSLITTAGAPIFGATVNEIAGYPLIPTEVLPGLNHAAAKTTATTYAIFGDLRKALAMGVRGGIEMKISDQATVGSDNLFEQDMVALRMIERVCFGTLLPSSYLVIRSS